MAEQKEAGGGGFAAEVGSLFELWNAPDGREWVGAEEMARQFQQAEDLLDGLKYTAERAVGYGAYIVLGDAKRLAARVREVRAEAVSRQGNRRTNVLIEITRKLVAADASIDCCAICGNDFNLGSVYAVATADRGEEIRLMCPTCLEYVNRHKEDAEGPTLRTWPAGGWLSTEELEEARRLFPESMFGTHDDLLAAATDRAADERIYGATLVWGMERETAVPEYPCNSQPTEPEHPSGYPGLSHAPRKRCAVRRMPRAHASDLVSSRSAGRAFSLWVRPPSPHWPHWPIASSEVIDGRSSRAGSRAAIGARRIRYARCRRWRLGSRAGCVP